MTRIQPAGLSRVLTCTTCAHARRATCVDKATVTGTSYPRKVRAISAIVVFEVAVANYGPLYVTIIVSLLHCRCFAVM